MWQRPSLDTKFHIDHNWWTESDKDIRVAVRGQLCSDCQSRFPDHRNLDAVDWVDPQTAEVVRADALLQTLRADCARKPGFIGKGNSLIANIFRTFLLNSNQALTPRQIHEQMPWAPADAILRTLVSGQIYMGIRPTATAD